MTSREELSSVLGALAAGQVVAIPTDTVYGLAADPRVLGASEALYKVKGRPETTPLPVLVSSVEEAYELGEFDASARLVVEHFWPGPLTVVVRRTDQSAGWPLGADPETIGLRSPGNELALMLLEQAGALAVTSANRHGEPPCQTAAQVVAALGDRAMVLDGGTCSGRPSTVVRLIDGEMSVLRMGSVSAADILQAGQLS